ncbi:HNH endonuclease [Klebsiella phage vB_KpnS_FZ41]|uniref:HNH endonuclease n=1 Tax=Klebsiella phage vB_KpnS_FZ41 TaxID=2530030 RepID=A0A4D6TC42_9CAUD|nr:HNH endonuclease [Klebsiella phage vB_KpnS_FZ41]
MLQRKIYPTLEEANKLFTYKDGKLFWKERGIPAWDKRYAGVEAGSNREHYRVVKIDSEVFYVHKIIYLMHNNGECPDFVDHEDTNTFNNYPDNLRRSTSAGNNQNASRRKDNTSGFKGVSWKANRNCWVVRVQVNGTRKEKSGFKTPEEAHEAGILLREQLHKEFARHE